MLSISGGPSQALRTEAMRLLETRGKAHQLRRVFHRSPLPMVIVDRDRRHLSSNRAARLLLRISAEEFRGLRIDDLTPPEQLTSMRAAWRRLMRDGEVAGTQDLALRGGVQLGFTYCAMASLLPGEHLVVFAPAEWPDEEVASEEGAPRPPQPGSLTVREREVLTLIAAGADFNRIAAELTISTATVKSHVRNALAKLGARNRPHAIALAMKLGVIDLPTD
jgi:DNA-binding CsgD family transcriptional regulator